MLDINLNIFLDYASLAIRRFYGLFDYLSPAQHRKVLGSWLNWAALITRDWCILPAGFVLECPVLQSVLMDKEALVLSRTVRISLADKSLAGWVAGRRAQYSPFKTEYPAAFEDKSVRLLERWASALVERVGDSRSSIVEAWREGPDRALIWKPITQRLSMKTVEAMRRVPRRIMDKGLAVTWEAIQAELNQEAEREAIELERILQHDFVMGYVREYGLLQLPNFLTDGVTFV